MNLFNNSPDLPDTNFTARRYRKDAKYTPFLVTVPDEQKKILLKAIIFDSHEENLRCSLKAWFAYRKQLEELNLTAYEFFGYVGPLETTKHKIEYLEKIRVALELRQCAIEPLQTTDILVLEQAQL